MKNILIVIILVAGLISALFLIKKAAIYLSQAEVEKGKPINEVRITDLAQDSATLVWETQEPVLSVVFYGTNPLNLSQSQAEIVKVANHQVPLTNLLPETIYYFKIQVGDQFFDQKGTPYSFTTLASGQIPSITEEEIRNALGTENLKYDLNKDGVVNLLDVFLFQQKSK